MAAKPHIPESVLVRIWEEQRFTPEDLKTTTGLPIQVIRRGWRNHDNGPDFKDVLIHIGEYVYAGDVELHLESADWAAHGHDTDPNYNRTILHVVLWESERPGRSNPGVQSNSLPGVQTSVCQIRKANGEEVPTAVVQHCLTEPLERLLETFRAADDRKHQRLLSCRKHIGTLPREYILTCLRQLGRKRLYARTQHFEKWRLHPPTPPSRGEFVAFQQLLYEAICEGLGYSSNKRPFVELARRLPIALIFSLLPKQVESKSTKEIYWIQAMLFGVSGLLPPGGPRNALPEVQTSGYDDPETIEYVTELRSLWEMIQSCLDVVPMKPEEWHFFRLRPPNFPTRRMAALSYLLFNYAIQPLFENYLRLLVMFSEHPNHKRQQLRLFEHTLEVPAAGYWKGRYCFGKPVFADHDRVFIGKARVRDILISAVFPVLLLYTLRTGQTKLETQLLKLYDIFPSPERNRITQTISEQLFEHRDTQSLHSPSASIYQGMLHLYKHYCYLPACTECPFHSTALSQPALFSIFGRETKKS